MKSKYLRLANTVGDRINQFDDLDAQTVESFNNLFPENPIKDKCPLASVTILGVEKNNCRSILVGDEILRHKMYSDILYTVDKERGVDERDIELDEINGVPL